MTTLIDFSKLPSFEGLKEAVAGMVSLAAPGKMGFTPLAMKKLLKDMRLILLSIIQCCWNGLDPIWSGIKTFFVSSTKRRESMTTSTIIKGSACKT
jgi:hypothetical protein